ncbi:hypothetical protein [Legionella sp. W05-934-2]|jgi:hypothetical protein|uniref:hypothetical protein n=1 Tax=Legionella sp. W05-934-2 TaxID=1198649 RepID=UPI003461EBBF
MAYKLFAERLNQELDNMDVPTHHSERTAVLAKLIHVPRFKAQAYLDGIYLPDEQILLALCNELEVDMDWLLGKK